MLGYVQIVTYPRFKKKYSLSSQGEACKDKIDTGKTPRSVGHFDFRKCYLLTPRNFRLRGVTYFANISFTNFYENPFLPVY